MPMSADDAGVAQRGGREAVSEQQVVGGPQRGCGSRRPGACTPDA